jgi:hypothetical protein
LLGIEDLKFWQLESMLALIYAPRC